jgi:acetyl-CoA C-acetyltransferase
METKRRSHEMVIVAGVGMTPVGEHWERSLRELALEAITAARTDAGGLRPQALYVANLLASAASGQTQLGALLADFAGLGGIEAMCVEAAGASGGMALRQAYMALISGVIDVALVIGVEKVTDTSGKGIDAALATAADADFEAVQGVTPAALAALLMQRYLHEHQAPDDALAGFSITAHANAATNPNAMYRHALRAEDYAQAPMVSAPLNLFDAAAVADGAAALVLVRADALPAHTPHPRVRILASAAATAALAIHDQPDPLALTAAAESAHQAYRQAGLGPEDIDLFELHDSFSVFAALALEAAGFAARGQGWHLARDGAIARDGSIPVSTMGGSKARGDTGGATGVYQAAEVVLQLQQRAGDSQVPAAHIGMAQCLGGTGATAATHILARVDSP